MSYDQNFWGGCRVCVGNCFEKFWGTTHCPNMAKLWNFNFPTNEKIVKSHLWGLKSKNIKNFSKNTLQNFFYRVQDLKPEFSKKKFCKNFDPKMKFSNSKYTFQKLHLQFSFYSKTTNVGCRTKVTTFLKNPITIVYPPQKV